VEAALKQNFNTFSISRRKKFALQKSSLKKPYIPGVVNVWDRLPNEVVDADNIITCKNRFDKYRYNQDVLFNFNADLIGTGSLPICM